MIEDVPHDVVHFICSACRATTWLTKEEAAHCAGTQMRCNKCGRNIDIPAGSADAGAAGLEPVPLESEFELRANAESVSRPKSPPRSHPTPKPAAVRNGPNQQPARNGDRDPVPGEKVVYRALKEAAAEESEQSAAVPRQRAAAPGRAPASTRKKKKKKRRRGETPQDAVLADGEPEFAQPEKRKGGATNLFANLDAWLSLAGTIASLGVYVVVAANTVPQGMEAATYVWNKLGFILTVIVIGTPVLLAASVFLGVCFGDLPTVLIKIPGVVLTQAWAEDLLTLQPLPYVPTFGAGRSRTSWS